MDNTAYGANYKVAAIIGVHSFLNQITVNFDGLKVLDNANINHAVNVNYYTFNSLTLF